MPKTKKKEQKTVFLLIIDASHLLLFFEDIYKGACKLDVIRREESVGKTPFLPPCSGNPEIERVQSKCLLYFCSCWGLLLGLQKRFWYLVWYPKKSA